MFHSILKNSTYWLAQTFLLVTAKLFFSFRHVGRDFVPRRGAVLICANHQSFLDPMLIGCVIRRPLNYFARKTLFKSRFFGWLITWFNSVPVNQDGIGLEGIKETLRRLKQDQGLMIFPEGSRTPDGRLQPFKPGFCSLARRGKAVLVPAAIDGAFAAWPRDRKWPRRHRVGVVFGEPIAPEQIAAMSDDELIAELQKRIEICFEQAGRLAYPKRKVEAEASTEIPAA